MTASTLELSGMVLYYLLLQVLNWHQDATRTDALSAVHFRIHDGSRCVFHVISPCEISVIWSLSRLALQFPSFQFVSTRRLKEIDELLLSVKYRPQTHTLSEGRRKEAERSALNY